MWTDPHGGARVGRSGTFDVDLAMQVGDGVGVCVAVGAVCGLATDLQYVTE